MKFLKSFTRGLAAGVIFSMALPATSIAAHSSAMGSFSPDAFPSVPSQNSVANSSLAVTPTLPIQNTIVVHWQPDAPPTYAFLTPAAATGESAHILPMTATLNLPANSLLSQSPITKQPSAPTGLIDNWELLMNEGFEGDFPQGSPCSLIDQSNDGFQRFWDEDDYNFLNGNQGAWPANGGSNGLDPEFNQYPPNMDTWLYCGPFNFSQAQSLLVKFGEWRQMWDGVDELFVGASLNGSNFFGVGYLGSTGDWSLQNIAFTGVAGDTSVWVAWNFRSDDSPNIGQGSWVDDLEVWRYNTPAQTCGNLDPGTKGVVLPPYDPTVGGIAPIIRAGDIQALEKLELADVRWVRLLFKQQNNFVNLQEYDRMVDSLCGSGISVLGLVNHETLVRQDFDDDDDATAAAYRLEFTNTVKFIVNHYQGRIKYWEVWNEENYDPVPGAATGAPYVAPERYAPLLDFTATAIRQGNPSAKVISGGLGSAWNDSNQYFLDVYVALVDARPFDYFAIHPYFNDLYGLDPMAYLHESSEMDPGDQTIIDKFITTMSGRGDGSKHLWVTELGWNSAKGLPNLGCLSNVVVSEQEQAFYLKRGFDILFAEVPNLDKIIWYQYMDVGISGACGPENTGATGMAWKGYVPAGGAFQPEEASAIYPWLFGLHQSDKTTAKLAWCAFAAYPQSCKQIFLPMIRR